ncbi:MAG TPA: DNA-3-methyladenine glycosylase, partial [Verrucomicrobiota bacterium]|nr:DNA-3-methyladenine glycosylase [Verrucomicrobiota bacterium]
MTPAAIEHLSAVDPKLAELIRKVGPCGLKPETRRPPFQSLVQAVAHQQLNGTAANTILTRFKRLFPGRRFPRAQDLAAVTDGQIRACGFSRAKIASIRDIAARTLDETIPTSQRIASMSNEEIIERLTQVRGVGRWTVEMLLIFQLGRMDVLPVDDFGVRNGFRIAYGKRALPTPQALATIGEKWKPHRTTAAWYLWRAVEGAYQFLLGSPGRMCGNS